ncbi:SDR family oxidoreductase [Porticoccaceae bacterium]|nr:SDR family oxidoreductase [Porticoccaceae bacterium]
MSDITLDPMLDFTDKVVLITGAASGLGAMLAEQFSERGAKLVLGDIDEDGLAQTASMLEGDSVTLRCDVTVESDCAALTEAACEMFGGLDIAINNAGYGHQLAPVDQLQESDYDNMFAVHAKGVGFGMKYQLPVMREHGGAIINISSMAGLGGAPMLGAYSAAKYAIVGLTKTAAIENATANIRVNAVCPFFTMTPLVTESGLIDKIDGMVRRAPMRRLAETEEVTSAILLLCSPANSYMTGQTIAIDGGVSAY